MDGSDSVSIFCGNKLENDIVLVENGLASILQASLRVENGLHERLGEKTKITVHKSCRQKYTQTSSNRASIKQKETPEIAPTTSSVLRSSEKKLDFENDCFICGKLAVVDSKYPLQRRKPVHFFSTLEIRDNIIAKKQCTIWGRESNVDFLILAIL
ncbi:hypothetical protein AVEN_30820-1 [Araneus ventricosus]|uniref:Uncharacterized protein n=1 Tax=Araneus ventricosus TaxID=182803 RepID=A0A4Y2KUG8_ARAVE|nr:hypothetical protein AVEN_30820-1 [Araneus ventricosus]